MKIPTVHKIPKKPEFITVGMPLCSEKEKDASRLPMMTYSFKNSTEIAVSPKREKLYLFCLLFLLWLPAVFYLFHAHSAVTAQVHHECLAVNLMKTEVEELMLKVNVLQNRLGFAASVGEHASKSNVTPMDNSVFSFRRPKRSDTEGFQAIHFKGAHPEVVVEAGRVGPWYIENKAIVNNEDSSSFQLREDGESVEIKEPGLYLIYAQVYYLTTEAFNSFSIILLPHDSEVRIPIALCSTTINSISSTSEVSCYTAVLRTLQMGDRIIVHQREKNRRIIMRGGHTFLGVAKLSGIRSQTT